MSDLPASTDPASVDAEPISADPATYPQPEADGPDQPSRRLGLLAAVAIAVFAADQLTKQWALSALADGPIDSIWTLRFQLLFNDGVAFSLGSGKGIGPWITLLGLAMVLGLSLGSTSRYGLGAVAGGMIAGGAFGNLADRAFRGDKGFMHGAVVDFIDLQWWPVFNIADAAVVVGAALVVLASFRMPAD